MICSIFAILGTFRFRNERNYLWLPLCWKTSKSFQSQPWGMMYICFFFFWVIIYCIVLHLPGYNPSMLSPLSSFQDKAWIWFICKIRLWTSIRKMSHCWHLSHVFTVENIKCELVQIYKTKRKVYIKLLITVSPYHSAVVTCNTLNYFIITIIFL